MEILGKENAHYKLQLKTRKRKTILPSIDRFKKGRGGRSPTFKELVGMEEYASARTSSSPS